jgi:hypothetical protein
MPTKRRPIERARRPQVTQAWAEVFKRVCQLSPLYLECIRGTCHSTTVDRRCAECHEYFELGALLKTHFSVRAWQELSDDFVEPAGLSAQRSAEWWADALGHALAEAQIMPWQKAPSV